MRLKKYMDLILIDHSQLQSVWSKVVVKLFGQKMSFEEAVRLSKRDTRRYVKRQITWFNHNYIPYKIINM